MTKLTNALNRFRQSFNAKAGKRFFLLITILLIVIVFQRNYGFTVVQGKSMCPTFNFKNGQCLQQGFSVLLYSKTYYQRMEPATNDIVLFEPANHAGTTYIKRVKGIPGQKVEINQEDVLVPENKYFLLGDNSQNSIDSANCFYNNSEVNCDSDDGFAFVPLANFNGKAILVLWPIYDLKTL